MGNGWRGCAHLPQNAMFHCVFFRKYPQYFVFNVVALPLAEDSVSTPKNNPGALATKKQSVVLFI